MDYENTWTNCDEPSASTGWRSTQQYPSSYFPGPYASSSTNFSFPNESSSYVNCSPVPYIRNDMNGNNNRYAFHPYHTCFGQTGDKGLSHLQPFHNVPAYSSDGKGNQCCESVGCQHQHMKTYLPHPCQARPNIKQKQTNQHLRRKKKQTNEVKNQNKKFSSVVGQNVATDNFTQDSFGQITNIPPHYSMNNQFIAGDNATFEYATNSCAFQQKEIVNLPSTLNNPASSMTHATTGLNMESIANFYDKDQNAITDENMNFDAFNISEDFMVTADVNSLQLTGEGFLPGKLQMKEVHNTNSDEGIMQEEVSGYTGELLENGEYTLQSVFSTKDEDGNDIFFLMATPEIKQGNTVAQFSLTDSEAIAQCTGTEDNADSTGNAVETKNDASGNESCLKDYAEQVNQGTDNVKIDINDIFLSSINDFASEEIVGTSDANTRKAKNKQHIIGLKNKQATASKQKTSRQWKKTCLASDCAMETTDSRNEQLATDGNTHVPRVKHKCRNNANANRLKWKSHFQWKSRTASFRDLQNGYFRKFMRKFRDENSEVDHDDVLQKVLRVILNKVGGSVMESVHKTFHEIIAIYTKDILEKEDKRSKPLQVKFSKQKN